MNKIRIILCLLSFLILTQIGQAKNRFNVGIGNDPKPIVNKDSFYVWAEDFGASWFYTQYPDSAGFYKNKHSLEYDLSTPHFQWEEKLYLSADSSLDLYKSTEQGVNFRMSGENKEIIWGYRRDEDTVEYIANRVLDQSIFRNVLIAEAGVDSAGLLLTKFNKGVFHWSPHLLLPHSELIIEANLKCGDLDTSGLGDTIVARLSSLRTLKVT